MTARSSFLFTTIAAVSFLTIAATSSVVLAQQGPVAGETVQRGTTSTNVGLAFDSIVVTRCRLGSTVETLAPKRTA